MGRYQSGQLGQTVNLLALRLRRFESYPAHQDNSVDYPAFGGIPQIH